MTGIIAIIMIFGMPVFIVGISKYFKYRMVKLEKESLGSPADRQRIESLEEERHLLEQRVQNLETIVCSVDLELNARLNKLAAHQSMLALPAAQRDSSSAVVVASSTATRATSGDISPGTTLMNRFQIERLLGRGGMGAVYLAADQQLGEQVALKVIASPLADDAEAVERFRREVSAARKITHPNVIRIHDLGNDSGLLFLSMEYFAGATLAELLRRQQTLLPTEAKPIIDQICAALTAAHQAEIVHRDLKPQNVLINDQGQVRVIDFGLAKATFRAGMTATGLILGTPEYMAPEQIKGGLVDGRTDIYALGAMIYHMVCGRPPFLASTPIAVGFLHCSEPPPPPRTLVSSIPEHWERALLRALAKNPAQRFAEASELQAALEG